MYRITFGDKESHSPYKIKTQDCNTLEDVVKFIVNCYYNPYGTEVCEDPDFKEFKVQEFTDVPLSVLEHFAYSKKLKAKREELEEQVNPLKIEMEKRKEFHEIDNMRKLMNKYRKEAKQKLAMIELVEESEKLGLYENETP